VALVRIWDASLKRAARGSLKIQDAKHRQKFAIWAPSHNFVGLYQDQGQVSALCLLDLTAVFDTVDHELLLYYVWNVSSE